MAIQEQLTVDAFSKLTHLPENKDKRLELIYGEVIEMSPSTLENSIIAGKISRLLGNYVAEKGLGAVTVPDGGFQINEDTVVVPDVAFITMSRLPENRKQFSPVTPDLAVEVISPSESHPSIRRKTRLYLEAGVQIVWNVFPDEKTVDVVTLGDDDTASTRTLRAEQSIDGGAAIPGFSVKVEAFFSL